MAKRVERRFKVDDFADDYVWLQLEEGEKRGMLFAVPREHREYGERLRESIEGMERGKRIRAALISENERQTAWRFTSIHELDRDEVPADD